MSSHLSKQQRRYPPTYGSRRAYAAMTPRRRVRAERAVRRFHSEVNRLETVRAQAREEMAEQAKRARRAESRDGSFVGRMFRRRRKI